MVRDQSFNIALQIGKSSLLPVHKASAIKVVEIETLIEKPQRIILMRNGQSANRRLAWES